MAGKRAGCAVAFLALALRGTLCAEEVSDARRRFIKGSIADKTAAVRESSGSERQLAESGLDFVIAYQPLLGGDRDLAALAVASALALPRTGDAEYATRITGKLVKVFQLFSDENVRIAVLDRMVPLAAAARSTQAVGLMNDYLATSAHDAAEASPVQLAVLTALGTVGDSASLSIVYALWRERRWEAHTAQLEETLVHLSEAHTTDAIGMAMRASLTEMEAYFDVLMRGAEKTQNFRAELAENVLSRTIHSRSDSAGGTSLARLQISALHVIAEMKWMRASQLVIRYFALAREEYESGALSEPQFLDVIACVARLASPEAAAALESYLSELNGATAAGGSLAKPVVLAVISALGELGDKAAFDTLLYVTYLSYPNEVVRAARDALARLKW